MPSRFVALVAAILVSSLGLVYAHEGHAHKLMGTVKAVHADMNHVEITVKGGKVSGFYVTPTTKYVQGKKAATLADLKPGARVVVQGTMENDKMTAARVQFGAGAATAASAHKH
jgi:hypothetical protein